MTLGIWCLMFGHNYVFRSWNSNRGTCYECQRCGYQTDHAEVLADA